MYNENELERLAAEAKNKLGIQGDEDIYANLMNEDYGTNNVSLSSVDVDASNYHPQLKKTPSDEDLNDLRNPILNKFDEPLFDGGPLKSQIDSWKKMYKGHDIYVVEILDQQFVFRTLNRFEYKQLVSLQNVDELQREEIICETVTLFPEQYDWKLIANERAGIPSTFSSIIMEKSGFTSDYAIQVL